MAEFGDEIWQNAFQEVRRLFEVESLLAGQENSLKSFFTGNHVFVNLPTGYSKSLMFQCLRIVANVLHGKSCGSSLVVVISLLRSLMDDQVSYLCDLGVPAVTITDEEDPELVQQILYGTYVIVFGSPECLLSTVTWRGLFRSKEFLDMLVGVAIDEAHCITQW